jgi:hypothetical protein
LVFAGKSSVELRMVAGLRRVIRLADAAVKAAPLKRVSRDHHTIVEPMIPPAKHGGRKRL